MESKTRITLLLIRQLVFGISYLYQTIYIGLLCFNIQIYIGKGKVECFKFENLFNK